MKNIRLLLTRCQIRKVAPNFQANLDSIKKFSKVKLQIRFKLLKIRKIKIKSRKVGKNWLWKRKWLFWIANLRFRILQPKKLYNGYKTRTVSWIPIWIIWPKMSTKLQQILIIKYQESRIKDPKVLPIIWPCPILSRAQSSLVITILKFYSPIRQGRGKVFQKKNRAMIGKKRVTSSWKQQQLTIKVLRTFGNQSNQGKQISEIWIYMR